jgi:hypothetical protein
MATHQLAQGLASLGRHGDTMLMHVSPQEVAGLQALGKMTGRRVTTNPHTGLPEAFDFGDFLGNLAPMFAGMILGPEVLGGSLLGEGGLGLSGTALKAAETALPIVGGAGTAAALGQDPLMGALGGYGGAGLGTSFAKMGSGYTAPSANLPLTTTGPVGVNQFAGAPGIQLGQDIGMNKGLATDWGQLGNAMNNLPSTDVLAGQPVSTVASGTKGGIENMMSGIGRLASDPVGQWSTFTSPEIGGSGLKLGLPIGMAAYDASLPDTSMSDEEKRKHEALKNKYRSSDGGLNLAASSGLNLGLPTLTLAAGGALSGAGNYYGTQAGGNQNTYGNSDSQGQATLSQDGYGIGRLASLTAKGSDAKAANEFYAAGGPIAFATGGQQGYLDGHGDGMSDSIPATIEGKQPARLADGEFVVPADVVSHIGNGSSKAGANRLYSMMNKIRKARTGTIKQGKQINPNKYLPA